MKKRRIFALGMFTALIVLAAGCGADNDAAEKSPAPAASSSEEKAPCCDLSTAKDGTWTAESSTHKKLGKSTIALTIQDHKITKVIFTGYTLDGRVKDADYGQDKESDGLKKKAQLAVKAMKSYAAQLQENQELGKVDAVTGATVSYEQFNEAAKKAIEQSKQ